MIGRLGAIALDCPDPTALALFYQGVLGGRIENEDGAPDANWIDLHVTDAGPRVSFQRSPGHVPPKWPGDDGDQQLHFDITVDDFDEADEALRALGARPVEENDGFRVYLDPAGHPFCTILY